MTTEVISTEYEAPHYIMRHRDLKSVTITVVDSNPAATIDISSFYISRTVNGLADVAALRELLSAVVSKCVELDERNLSALPVKSASILYT